MMRQHSITRPHWWSLLAVLWLLLAAPIFAQASGVQIIDPDGLLGGQRSEVEQAAQQLADEGAQVIVVTHRADPNDTAQTAEQDLSSLLSENNLASSPQQLNPNQIVYYVRIPDTDPDQGFTGIYFGTTWRDQLDPVYQSIADQQITAQASTGDLAGGLIAGINATRNTINPPTPSFVYVLAGVLGLAIVGLIAAPILRRRRETATALSTARAQATQARRDAGAAIADLGRRMETARAKAQYDALSYAPADAQRVTAQQQEAEQAFVAAQAAFDAADEQERTGQLTTANDYQRLAAAYGEARDRAKQAADALTKVERLRATLDAQGTSQTTPPA